MEASCIPDLVPSFTSKRSGAWTEGPSSAGSGAGPGVGSSCSASPLGGPCLTCCVTRTLFPSMRADGRQRPAHSPLSVSAGPSPQRRRRRMMRTCTAAWRSWQSKEPAGGREGSGGQRRALLGLEPVSAVCMGLGRSASRGSVGLRPRPRGDMAVAYSPGPGARRAGLPVLPSGWGWARASLGRRGRSGEGRRVCRSWAPRGSGHEQGRLVIQGCLLARRGPGLD